MENCSASETVFVIQAHLIEQPFVSLQELAEAKQYLQSQHYEAVYVERALMGKCGWPVCGNTMPTEKRGRYRISKGQIFDDEGIEHYCSVDCMKRSQTFDSQLSQESIYHRTYKKRDQAEEAKDRKERKERSGNNTNANTNTSATQKSRGRGSAIGNAVRGGLVSHDPSKPGGIGKETKSNASADVAVLLGPIKESRQSLIGAGTEVVNSNALSQASNLSPNQPNSSSIVLSESNPEKSLPMIRPVRERVVEKQSGGKTNASPSKGTNIIGTSAKGKGSKSNVRKQEEEAIEFDDDLPPLEDLSLTGHEDYESDEDDDPMGALAHFMQRPEDMIVPEFDSLSDFGKVWHLFSVWISDDTISYFSQALKGAPKKPSGQYSGGGEFGDKSTAQQEYEREKEREQEKEQDRNQPTVDGQTTSLTRRKAFVNFAFPIFSELSQRLQLSSSVHNAFFLCVSTFNFEQAIPHLSKALWSQIVFVILFEVCQLESDEAEKVNAAMPALLSLVSLDKHSVALLCGLLRTGE